MTTDPTAISRLPIGIQSFLELRKENRIYVDKTADILRFVTDYKAVFLSRPRRFGKSLLISTLEELFKGNEAIFQGLAIHDKWDWSKKHPVVRIDWSRFEYSSLAELRRKLAARFRSIASDYGVGLEESTLDELIEALHKKTGQRVVVLIDEYDMLMLDAISDSTKFEQMKAYLHSVYRSLKSAGEHIHFLFLTGVSRFAGVSIFSGLNNLRDITLDPCFATLCGCTQTELETNFAGHIEETAAKLNYDRDRLLSEMKSYYNGYSWDGETRVYNPYSILLFFCMKRFENFWFKTGTPSFLVELVKTNANILSLIDTEKACSLDVSGFDPENMFTPSLLFQTGYLTIQRIKETTPGDRFYFLDFPNTEVKNSFLRHLLMAYSRKQADRVVVIEDAMREGLRNGDVTEFEKNLRTLLAGIPYLLVSKNPESHYHVIMLTWLRLLGYKAKGEDMTIKGRIDAVLEFPERIYIIEIKIGQDAGEKEKLLDAALAQIKTNGYADAYLNFTGKISLLGIAIADGDVACRMEVLKE